MNHDRVILPPSADINDDGNAADHRRGATQRCNDAQSQEVADWAWLELLSEDGTIERSSKTSRK